MHSIKKKKKKCHRCLLIEFQKRQNELNIEHKKRELSSCDISCIYKEMNLRRTKKNLQKFLFLLTYTKCHCMFLFKITTASA